MNTLDTIGRQVDPNPEWDGDLRATLERATAAHRNGDLERAQALYERILRVHPGHFGSLRLLGALSYQKKDDARARELLKKAIRVNPHVPSVYLDLGNVLRREKQWDAAVSCYDAAIALQPDYAAAHNNRGKALHELGNVAAAIASYRQALNSGGTAAEVLNNLGNALEDLGHVAEAVACYDRAIAMNPGYAEPYWNKGLSLLRAGDFENGFPLYERRWENETLGLAPRMFHAPRWDGVQALRGKTILLYNEQGLGDWIQFCRYAPLVKALGARVVMEVPRDLASVFQGLAGVDRLVVQGEPAPPFDFHCSVLSLPRVFRSTPANVPPPATLQPDQARWRARIGPRSRPRIGLAWSGNPAHANDRSRSVPLSRLAAHLPDAYDYVCLQKDLRDDDRRVLDALGGKIAFHGPELVDFSDTFALCGLMDLVVSVDTSVAHLAATLGRPTWILLPYTPDWRWMRDRADSVWYPGVRLIRQDGHGDWTTPLAQLRRDILRAITSFEPSI